MAGALALTASVVVVVGVVAVFLSARQGARHGGAPSAPLMGPAGGPVPPGFDAQSVTAISDRRWWVLGQRPCPREACLAIVRTTDGGRSFDLIPAPKVPFGAGGCRSAPVTQLAFADPRDGFAYGCTLYVTHDGGAHWRTLLPVRGYVSGLAVAGGDVYLSVTTPNGSGGSSALFRSPVSRDDWALLFPRGSSGGRPAFGGSGDGTGIAARGSDVFVQQTGNRTLMISHDRAHFSQDNSLGFGLPCTIQPVSVRVVWAFCAGGTMGHVLRSTNGGHTFAAAEGGQNGAGASNEYHGAVFAAADSTTAVVGFGRLLRTADAGRSYAPVGPRGLWWQELVFIDPKHGLGLTAPPRSAAGGTRPEGTRLYLTTDGGITYHVVAIRSAPPSAGRGARCRSSQLKLGIGQPPPGKTQQNPVLLELRNDSSAGCSLIGYPRIVLQDREGALLPFSYRNRGDQELSNNAPAQVWLPPRGNAYIGLNQNVCVLHPQHNATEIQIILPEEHLPLTLALGRHGILDYCAPRDPAGHVIDVSPLEPTERKVFAGP